MKSSGQRPADTSSSYSLTTASLRSESQVAVRTRPNVGSLHEIRLPRPQNKTIEMETAFSNSLLIALAQARRAVELDTIGSDPQGAIDAYKRSVTLLKGAMTMMETRAALANTGEKEKEYELNRLAEIHDKYLARIQTLCDALGLPFPE